MRTSGSSSNTTRCSFCNKRTSSYIKWGETISIEIRVCEEHEKTMNRNNVALLDRVIIDDIKSIRNIALALIEDDEDYEIE
jgi:hypothetical protein